MDAILKLNCLDFVVIDIVAKLTNASYFVVIVSCTIFLLFVCILVGLGDLLYLCEDSSTFRSQLFILPLHKIIIACACDLEFQLRSRLAIRALICRIIIVLFLFFFSCCCVFIWPGTLFSASATGACGLAPL